MRRAEHKLDSTERRLARRDARLVAKIWKRHRKNKFLRIFFPVVEEIARIGAINSLRKPLLTINSPGVPDIYQATRFGTSRWSIRIIGVQSIYKHRREMLATIGKAKPENFLQSWPDAGVKMFLTQRVLQFRREHADLFQSGNYFLLRRAETLPIAALVSPGNGMTNGLS